MHLALFGPPTLSTSGSDQTLRTNNPNLALIYLASRADWVSRSELAFLYKPDETEEKALAYLRLQLHRAKQNAWAAQLEIDPNQLRWRVSTDVQAFRQTVQEENWQEAIALYKAPFLAGQSFKGLVTYAAWVELEREQLGQSYALALKNETERFVAEGDFTKAAELSGDYLALDDLDEDALHLHLRCLALSGQKSRALKQFQAFKILLADEFDLDPRQSTLELIRSIEADEVAAQARTAASVRRPSLPQQGTRFVGRKQELKQLQTLLAKPDCRLVTVIGLGGAGKTRLALEAARANWDSYPDGVHLIALAPLTNEANVMTHLMQQFGLKAGSGDLQGVVIQYLQDKHALLFMDNFEHLLGLKAFVQKLITQVPQLKLLVTSRERLNLQSEWLFELGGLSYPAVDAAEPLVSFEAYQLFTNGVRRLMPTFQMSERDLDTVAELCRRLEGLPLALELAASWVSLMPLERILTEVDKGIDVLHSDLADLPERQRSMRSVLSSTWTRLSAAQQDLLAKLSVFQGGFTLEAVEAVTGAHLALLLSLYNKSLIERTSANGFGLHEIVRHYALEEFHKLKSQVEVRSAHLTYYCDTVHDAAEHFDGLKQVECQRIIKQVYENIRSALDWSLETEPASCMNLTADMGVYWERTGNLQEANFYTSRALKKTTSGSPETKLKLYINSLSYAQKRGDYDRVEELEPIIQNLCEQVKKPEITGAFYNLLGMAATDQQKYEEADKLLRKSSTLAKVAQDANLQSYLSLNLGRLAADQRDTTLALEHYREALTLAQKRKNENLKMCVLSNIAGVYLAQEDYASAICLSEEAMELAIHLDEQAFVALNKGNLGFSKWQMGLFEEASQLYTEHLLLLFESDRMLFFVCNLHELASFWVHLGKVHEGVTLWSAADHWRKVRDYPDFPGYEQLKTKVLSSVDDSTKESMTQLGASLSLDIVAMLKRDLAEDKTETVLQRSNP